MNKHILGLTLAVSALVMTSNAQAALITVVDDFTTGGMTVMGGGSSSVAASGALGGYRTVSATASDGSVLGGYVIVDTTLGTYSLNAGASTSASSTMTWDANGVGLGGLDWLTGFNNQSFDLNILYIDQGSVDLTLSIVDLTGSIGTHTFSGLGTGIQSLVFSDFSGIDFTQVNSMSLLIDGGQASDFTLQALGVYGSVIPSSVPEPSFLALLGMGLAVFGFARRKKSA